MGTRASEKEKRQVSQDEGRALAHHLHADLWAEVSSKAGLGSTCCSPPQLHTASCVWLKQLSHGWGTVSEVEEQLVMALVPSPVVPQPSAATAAYQALDTNGPWVRSSQAALLHGCPKLRAKEEETTTNSSYCSLQ